MLDVFRDPAEPAAIRGHALRALSRSTDSGWLDASLDVLKQPRTAGAELHVDVTNRLGVFGNFARDGHEQLPKISAALRDLTAEREPAALRYAAFGVPNDAKMALPKDQRVAIW